MSVSIERDLNDVLIFLQVVESGSFTAAGRKLGVPTSTVSRRVQRLEDELGVRLLQRTTRKLSLTEAGKMYRERTSELFAGLEEAENILADAQVNPKGRIRVTAPLEHGISMRVVTPFLERYPDVRVCLELTSRPVNIIEEGYDAALVAGELPSLSVVAHKLLDSSFRLVASPSYVERRGAPERLEDLAEHDCVVFGHPSGGATWNLAGQDITVRSRIATNHMAAVRDATLAGLGVALLADLICAEHIEAGTLVALLPDAAPPPVPIWITYPSGRYLAPAVRAFVDHVRETFPAVALE